MRKIKKINVPATISQMAELAERVDRQAPPCFLLVEFGLMPHDFRYPTALLGIRDDVQEVLREKAGHGQCFRQILPLSQGLAHLVGPH